MSLVAFVPYVDVWAFEPYMDVWPSCRIFAVGHPAGVLLAGFGPNRRLSGPSGRPSVRGHKLWRPNGRPSWRPIVRGHKLWRPDMKISSSSCNNLGRNKVGRSQHSCLHHHHLRRHVIEKLLR